MKKIVLILAVLLLATPVWATVTITCTPAAAPSDKVTVSFVNDDPAPAKRVRAFALEITVDTGCIWDGTSLSADYWVHPGSIDINDTTGVVDDVGTCVGEGLGTVTIVTEQGSLYIPGNEPLQSGNLLQFRVKNDCIITVALNAIRGGIICEDGTTPAVVLNGVTVSNSLCATCAGDVMRVSMYNNLLWTNDISSLSTKLIAKGAPYRIFPADPLWDPCADVNRDGMIWTNDLSALSAKLIAIGAPYRMSCDLMCP